MSKGTDSDDRDEIPIVVDGYGIKVTLKARPDELGEPTPTSWKDVPYQVNRHLMRIAAAPTRLIAEVLEGAARIVRGLSRIPSSVASRLQRAHIEADARESKNQEAITGAPQRELAPGVPENSLTSGETSEDNAARAISQIQAILKKYSDQGRDAYIVIGSDGKPIVVLGAPPNSEAQIREAIDQARALLDNPLEREP
jgi:hypothetical protein